MSRHPFWPLRWLALLLCAASLVGGDAAPVRAQEDGLFDRLFGNDPATERAGKAADGLALPALFADGKLIVDAIALHDLGADGGACVAILPLLEALELAHETAGADIALTLPEPRRTVEYILFRQGPAGGV